MEEEGLRLSVYDIYYRTKLPWGLNEVLYVIHYLGIGVPIKKISEAIKRPVFQIEREFLTCRPKLPNGSYDSSRSVAEEEVNNFDFEKQNIIKKWNMIYEGDDDGEIRAEVERFTESLNQKGWKKLQTI